MKPVMLNMHSANNEQLFQLTLLNHAEYAGKYEYHAMNLNVPLCTALGHSADFGATGRVWGGDSVRKRHLVYKHGHRCYEFGEAGCRDDNGARPMRRHSSKWRPGDIPEHSENQISAGKDR